MISIIIPVLNEEQSIGAVIDHLESLGYNDKEIIVVDGDPRGSTLKAVADRSAVTAISEPGRARQMNEGARISRGDVLLFLHADTSLPEEGLDLAEQAMASDSFVAGAFDLGLDDRSCVFRLIGCAASLKHRLTRVPYGDQAIFIKRDYFFSMGGYSDMPLMEDVDLMRRIKKRGGKIVIIPRPVTSSARKWKREGVCFTVLRNYAIQILYLLGVSPDKLVRYYYKRKK